MTHRACVFGYGYNDYTYGAGGIASTRSNHIGSETTTQGHADADRDFQTDYPLETNDHTGTDAFNAYHHEGRRWNIMACTWDLNDNTNGLITSLAVNINGQAVSDGRRTMCRIGQGNEPSTPSLLRPWEPTKQPDMLAPIRLGDLVRKDDFESSLYGHPADATYGMFAIYDAYQDVNMLMLPLWQEQFYYQAQDLNTETAAYTSPLLDLGADPGQLITIRSLSWTSWWPDYMAGYDANVTNTLIPEWGQLPLSATEEFDFRDPVWGDPDYQQTSWMQNRSLSPADWDPFTLDIKVNAGLPDEQWLYGGNTPDTPLSYCGGSVPAVSNARAATGGPIQIRVHFNVPEPPDPGLTVRESPYLDDITITYIPASGAKFLYYQMH
ncbi:hypothetical protein ACFL54_05125 [Planctomycetota bacterium]